MIARLPFTIFLLSITIAAHSQAFIHGTIKDAHTNLPLSYVNIGIRNKNVGTASLLSGVFALQIPAENVSDSMTFSLVGYHDLHLSISELANKKDLDIRLEEKIMELKEVRISADKPVERKFGIKKRNLLVHFTDGMFSENDIFEIGQLIRLGTGPSQITSANLYISETKKDSANFRINFYEYDGQSPGERIFEKSIIQKHAVTAAWLRFDLTQYDLFLKGEFVVTIEFIPEPKTDKTPILYEVKLGGGGKSFYRKNSLGKWNTPPHHYCLYITALISKNVVEEPEVEESAPTFTLYSEAVKDSFSVFVQLPKGYNSNDQKRYPVVYHLDGNAYFDHISGISKELSKQKSFIQPIIVGIGYQNAYVMDSLRVRDYTFPKAVSEDSLPVSGGGEKFYWFIKNELVPRIEKTYRSDSTNRTLMGHSFGGYFTLFALLMDIKHSAVFNNYVAASPSVKYHDSYLINQFNSLPVLANRDLKLFVTTGEMEVNGDSGKSFESLKAALSKLFPGQFYPKIYKDLEHMGTAIPTFEEGLKRSLTKNRQ